MAVLVTVSLLKHMKKNIGKEKGGKTHETCCCPTMSWL